ncbi:16S rRNA pseudouridine(516) synthase [Mycoplasma sp. AC157]|uniref:16S rRNA pseudouridine(516) synthase n=1 Tax=Mycoplasma sp. 480 TaxID=3440155 RepID=UPI003F51085E
MKRIEKIISDNCNLSRTEIKKLILKEQILVNNSKIKVGQLFQESYLQITINGNSLYLREKFIYILLNKPAGYVCANKDNLYKTVFDLLPESITNIKNLHTIGRLDLDTEGLLIITNDGESTHNLLSPKKHIIKKYYVELDKEINFDLLKEKFAQGFYISQTEKVKPSFLELIEKNKCFLSISEGKFHQVKRMFLSFDYKVTYLKRVKFNNLNLPDDLELGQYKIIKKEDLF